MIQTIKNRMYRISSNRGDSNTISILLWIVFAVVLVLFVGKLIYDAVSEKATKTADCIKNSNSLFKTSGDCQ